MISLLKRVCMCDSIFHYIQFPLPFKGISTRESNLTQSVSATVNVVPFETSVRISAHTLSSTFSGYPLTLIRGTMRPYVGSPSLPGVGLESTNVYIPSFHVSLPCPSFLPTFQSPKYVSRFNASILLY